MGAPERTAAGTVSPGSLPSMSRLGTGENVLFESERGVGCWLSWRTKHTISDNPWQRCNQAGASPCSPWVPLAWQGKIRPMSNPMACLVWWHCRNRCDRGWAKTGVESASRLKIRLWSLLTFEGTTWPRTSVLFGVQELWVDVHGRTQPSFAGLGVRKQAKANLIAQLHLHGHHWTPAFLPSVHPCTQASTMCVATFLLLDSNWVKLTDYRVSAVEMNFTQKRGLSTLIPPKVKVLSYALKRPELTAVDCLSKCKSPTPSSFQREILEKVPSPRKTTFWELSLRSLRCCRDSTSARVASLYTFRRVTDGYQAIGAAQDAQRMQKVVSFYESLPRGPAPEPKPRGLLAWYQAKYFGNKPSPMRMTTIWYRGLQS